MKLYNNINATFKMQDYGSAWLIVMRGTQQEIEWLFNAFYNFGAVDKPEVEWNELNDSASFWTNEEKMDKFFCNFCLNRKLNKGFADDDFTNEAARVEAENLLNNLYNKHRESRSLYHYGADNYEFYTVGKVCAESPDADMKDAILAHAYADKTETLEKPQD